jgi:hypothetical protein
MATGVEMQATWRVYLVSAVLACVVAAGTAFIMVRLLVPQAPSTRQAPDSPNAAILDGVAELPWGAELEVFYKAPFSSPPTLTFPEGLDGTACRVGEQKAGSFMLVRDKAGFVGPNIAKVKWKAEGQTAK